MLHLLIWNARSHALKLTSGLPTGLHALNTRPARMESDVRLPTGLHAWKAKYQT